MRSFKFVAVAVAALVLGGCDGRPTKAAEVTAHRPFDGTTVKHDGANGVTCWVYSHPTSREGGIACLPDWMLTPAPRKPVTDECLIKDVGSEACRKLFGQMLPACKPKSRAACVDANGEEWPADGAGAQ